MNVGVVGSRNFYDYSCLKEQLDLFRQDHEISQIVSGGADGADTLAELYAKENSIKKLILKAEWQKYGKRAGYLRNVDIIKNSDVLFAFQVDDSKGTAHSIKLAIQRGIKIYHFKFSS